MMRTGPKPLPFQLGMASLASAGLAGGTVFDAKILQDFFKGIQRYQTYNYKRPAPIFEKVWGEGQAGLFRVPGTMPQYRVPVVLIPSMINRSDILDLLPEKSLLRWLSVHGLETYLFDWGVPVDDNGQDNFDSAVATRLLPALNSLSGPVIIIGYCMGGLFSTAVAALRPEIVRAQILLATPWNFHDQSGYLKNRLTIMGPMAVGYMQQYSRLPESWMQAVFASLDPEGSIRKFSNFANMADPARERLFIAVEDWLNEGMDLPSGIAKTCLINWYERNEPYSGGWEVQGKKMDARQIGVPTLIVAAKGDRIVPADSALGYADKNSTARTLVCETGHVGLLAGGHAEAMVWKPIADWCIEHNKT